MSSSAIWHTPIVLAELNAQCADTAVTQLGIEFFDFGADWLAARMPVDSRTRQPFGLLHGGASVLLAETLGSSAANLCVDTRTHYCVGQEINASHLRAVRDGCVHGRATPLRIGRSSQVWEIRIADDGGRSVCVARLTLAVCARRDVGN